MEETGSPGDLLLCLWTRLACLLCTGQGQDEGTVMLDPGSRDRTAKLLPQLQGSALGLFLLQHNI